jgi:hypothetical protein
MTTLTLAREPVSYLRPEFLRTLGHEGLMRLLTVITHAPNRDWRDDEALDAIASEVARRQSPLCAVCACGATGVCDERCDWINGLSPGWRA